MKDEEGRIVEGEDEELEVMTRHWEDLRGVVRTSEDDVVPDTTAMGDVGGCELGCVEEREGSWPWWNL